MCVCVFACWKVARMVRKPMSHRDVSIYTFIRNIYGYMRTACVCVCVYLCTHVHTDMCALCVCQVCVCVCV